MEDWNRKVIKFSDSSSFGKEHAEDFIRLLYQSDARTRQHILDTYGFRIEDRGEGRKLRYDGRRVGIGHFRADDKDVTFQLLPKVETLRLKNLFSALGEEHIKHNRGRFEKLDSRSPVTQDEGNFTPSFLLALLEEIRQFASRFNPVFLRRKEIFVKGGVKGRPLLRKSITNILLGRQLGWNCEVLDNAGLHRYIVVLLATAHDIEETLKEWAPLLKTTNEEPREALKEIQAHLGTRDTSPFSTSLLMQICRPPYPFGLRDILLKCLRYWRWKGYYRADDQSLRDSSYYGLVVQMDSLFDDYVGIAFRKSLDSSFAWQRNFTYEFTLTDEKDNHSNKRGIDPDHIFASEDGRRAFIVEVKYKEEVDRSDLFQILAYLTFHYPKSRHMPALDNSFTKIGVLAYPGAEWKCKSVSNFDSLLFIMELPIKQNGISELLEFTSRSFQSKE